MIGWVVSMVSHNIGEALLFYLIWVIVRTAMLIAKRKRGERQGLKKEILLWCFAFYIVFIYQITIFRGYISISRLTFELGTQRALVFLPFKTTIELLNDVSIWIYNTLGNIFWFVPYGILLPAVFKKCRSAISVSSYVFIFSLSIETFQFILHTGTSDIDDLIFNTLGGFLGYLIWKLACLKTKKLNKS